MGNIIYLFYAFVLGSVFASFSSAIAWRTGRELNVEKNEKETKVFKENLKEFFSIKHLTKEEKKYSVIYGRSMCPHCEATLPWWALIPIFSYIYLRGKCFNCKKHISIFYFMMEIVCGIFTSLLALNLLNNNISQFVFLLYGFVFFILIILSYQDLWFGQISDRIALSGIVITFIAILFNSLQQNNLSLFSQQIIITFILLLIFGLLVIFTNSMGGGDLRAFALMGLTLNFENILLSITIGFLLASIVGILQAVILKKDISKFHVRLIPYLTFGFAFMAVFGENLIKLIFT